MEREKSLFMKTQQVPETNPPQVEKFGGWAMSSWDLVQGLDVVEGISLDDWERERVTGQPRPAGSERGASD